MKKMIYINFTIILLFLNFISLEIYGSDVSDEEMLWTKDDISFIISSSTIKYERENDLYIQTSLKNISEKKFTFFSNFLPLSPMKLKFETDFKDEIIFDYYLNKSNDFLPNTMRSPLIGVPIECSKNEIIYDSFSLNKNFNIEEIRRSGVIFIYGNYPISELINESEFQVYDYKESNKIRIFFNMEQDLISSSIRVEPHKWNVNWEDMEGDGVFTIWIESVEGFSVEDIKQDTILFNGTLPPTEIKILPKSTNDKTKIMQLKFKKKDGILYLGELKSGETKTINISGQLNNEKWFIGETQVELIGNK